MEEFLLTTARNAESAVDGSILVALPGDFSVGGQSPPPVSVEKRRVATVVGVVPEADVALLQLVQPNCLDMPALKLSELEELDAGDFVVSVGALNTTLGVVSRRASELPTTTLADESSPIAPPTTADAALARAEEEAGEAGVANFLVADSPACSGMSGGALLDAEGALVGLVSTVFSAFGETRTYAVSAKHAALAARDILARQALGEKLAGKRVVLLNDSVNKRERVQEVLTEAGLSEQAANFAMLAAHKSGRGVVGYFKQGEGAAAEALRVALEDRGLLVAVEPWEYYAGDEAAASQAPGGEQASAA